MSDPELGGRAVMGVVMLGLAGLGVVLFMNAVDLPMTVFGCALGLFGAVYVIGLARQHFSAVQLSAQNAGDAP